MDNVLPDKPSELIRLAVKDLTICEQMPETYKINMGVWHDRMYGDNKCHVCLAGSVMAQTLGADPTREIYPSETDEQKKLRALSSFAFGEIEDGLSYLSLYGKIETPEMEEICSYSLDPEQFKADMLELAQKFEDLGY